MTLRISVGLLITHLWLCGAGVVEAQGTEAATRQYAVAVGFQNQKLFDAAIDEWQTFLRKYPKDPRVDRAQHYLGTCCLQEKRYPEAIAAFEKVIKDHSKFELLDQSMLNLGIAHYGQAQQTDKKADYAAAERAFGRMLTTFAKSQYAARALYYRGECLYQLDQVDKAAAAYEKFVKTYPDDALAADAIYALGTTQESLKQPQQALAAYAKFARRFPKHELITEVQMRRGEILFDAGEYEQAQPIFEAVSGDRQFELADVAMLRHARCLYERGQIVDAARTYWDVPRQFKQTKHYDAAILAGAKCYIIAEEYARARSGLEQVAKRDVPEAAEATQWLARSFLKEGDASKALKIAEQGARRFQGKAYRPELDLVRIDAMYEVPGKKDQTSDLYAEFVKKNPDHEQAPQAQYMAALAALDAKQYAAAKSNCDEFLGRYGNSGLKPDVLFIKAESQLLLGEHKDAADQYQAFLAVGGAHANAAQARVRRGLALHMSGEHQQAVRWLEPVTGDLSDKSLRSEAFSILGRSYVALEQYPQATKALEQSIQEQPDRAQNDESLLALADVYRRMGRDAEADTQLQTILTRLPNSRLADEVNYRLAEAAFAGERYQDAMTFYQKVVSRWPDSEFAPHAQYGLGWALFNLGEFAKSSDAMSTLIENYRRSRVASKGLYVRAMSAFQLGDHAKVLQDVDSFLSTKPAKNDALDARYVKGLAEAGQQKFSNAAETYRAILKDADGYPAADKVAYELGWALVELGKTKEAVDTFSMLATNWPNSPLAAEALFRVGEAWYDAEKYADAVAAYQKASDRAGRGEIGEKSMHKLGWSLLKADDVMSARDAFAKQLSKYPDGELAGDARFLTGECSFKQQDWETARRAFEKVAAAGDSSYGALAMFRVGECAAALQDWASSRTWHQKVLDQYPDFEMRPEARYGLAWALQNEAEYDKAVTLYEQVTEETQTETAAKARFMIGECCFAQKKHQEATRHFLKAAFLYNHPEWSAMAYFEAARCFEVLKDIEQARSCYDQLTKKYPQHPRVRDAQRRLAELK